MTKEEILKIGFFGERRWLSNMYPCKIEYQGFVFPSSENAYQASKCADKNDKYKFTKIEPVASKKLGRIVQLLPNWDSVKLSVMKDIVYSKFFQNPELKQKLVETEEEELVEHNFWWDKYWGKHFGEGVNNLGIILMDARSLLK